MSFLPLRWTDGFAGSHLDDGLWVGGYANPSREIRLSVDNGVHITLERGEEYASAAVVLREPVEGDFDARVRFTVANPQLATTFEMACITIDPPGTAELDQSKANKFTRSLVYDVHGAPPYVSSEFDENQGWRIGWNRGPAITLQKDGQDAYSDNRFNRYGRDFGGAQTAGASGWLRLVRKGSHWITYGRRMNDPDWFPTGEIRHMALPLAVYLRLAAKHWVKSSVSAAAPENLVTFHEFELRAAQGAPSMAAAKVRPPNQVPVFSLSSIPTEVRLVHEVRSCAKCAVFGSDTPYGPFMHVQVDGAAEVTAAAAVPATITAFKPPEPAVLHGCRKAPIMLVGINPNLPGHFIFPWASAGEDALNGSFRVFTEFRSDQAYAAYYRKAPEGALSIASRASLEAVVRGAGAIVAAADGRLILKDVGAGVSERAPAQRTARLLAMPLDAIQPNAFGWNLDENLVVLRHIFKKGETIASHADSSVVGKTVDITRQRLDSYYENATDLLKAIGKHLGCETLQLGEDMSLHDAVACASPGWSNWQLPQEEIRSNCIDKSRWLHQQIEQSNPAVLLITSREAFNLFVSGADGSFVPPLDQLASQGGGTDGLFYRVAQEGLIWTHRALGMQTQTRIVLAPHLSYDSNFRPHSYLKQADWETFSKMDADGVAWLRLHGISDKAGEHLRDRITQVYGTDDYMVELPDPANGADPIWTHLREKHTKLAQFLFARWIAPFELIGGAVAGEVRRLDIRIGEDGHLQRSRGACSFCDNDFWKIGAGCAFAAQPAH